MLVVVGGHSCNIGKTSNLRREMVEIERRLAELEGNRRCW